MVSDCGLCAICGGHGYKHRKDMLRNGLEESLCVVTVMPLFPAELRFKELQVKGSQPNRISLSSTEVRHAKSHPQWQGMPLAFLRCPIVPDHVLSKLKYRQAEKMKAVSAQGNR